MQVNLSPAVCHIRGLFLIFFLDKARRSLHILVHSVSSLLLCRQHRCNIPFRKGCFSVVVWRCNRETAMGLLATVTLIKHESRKQKGKNSGMI